MKWTFIHDWIVPLFGAVIFVSACAAMMLSVVTAPHTGKMVQQPNMSSGPLSPPKAVVPSQVTSTAEVTSSARVHVYECLTEGVKAFSQHSCGAGAKLREIDTSKTNTMPARYYAIPEVAESTQAYGSSEIYEVTGGGASAELVSRRPGTCANIEELIAEVEARLRHGYSIPEGNRLRAELHELFGQSYDLRCGR